MHTEYQSDGNISHYNIIDINMHLINCMKIKNIFQKAKYLIHQIT